MNKIVLLFVIVFSALTQLNAQNLILNPGFETWSTVGTNNVPNNWTINTPSNVSQNTLVYNGGVSSCKVTAAGTTYIYQQVAVTAGKTYTFNLSYYYHTTTGSGVQIRSYFRTSKGARAAMTLDDSLALNGPGGGTLYFPKVTGSWKTYTCDVVAPANATAFVFYVVVASTSTVSLDNCGFTLNTTPTIYPSKTTLTGFTYLPGAGPSAEQSFTVKGSNLTTGIAVTAPANYEISATSGASFVGQSSITVPLSTGGLVNSITLYVRLKSGLALNTYSGNISLSATGATTQTILLSGSVAYPVVVITPSVTTLSGFAYTEGNGPSGQQTFSVSGSNLTAGITLTAPANYEISAISGSSFGNSITLTPTGGVISSVPIYVRLKSGLLCGTYSGNISLVSGNTTQNVALSGSVSGLNVSATTLSGLNYVFGAGPSTIQSFNVYGQGLTGYLIVTAPADYEISTTNGSSFVAAGQILLPSNTTVATPIYLRLKAGLAVNSYSENISISSTGFTTKTLAASGSVTLKTALENTNNDFVKIYSGRNQIIVEGVAIGESIKLYNLMGIELKSVLSNGEKLTVPVKEGAVYLVRLKNRMVKVAL